MPRRTPDRQAGLDVHAPQPDSPIFAASSQPVPSWLKLRCDRTLMAAQDQSLTTGLSRAYPQSGGLISAAVTSQRRLG